MIRRLWIWIWVCLGQVVHAASPEPNFNAGNWYKVGFLGGGVYFVDQAWFQANGLPWQTFQPDQVRVWGGDPSVLPQTIQPVLPDKSLMEQPVWSTFAQNRWSRQGRLYFYVPPAFLPEGERHPYSDSSYVYLTWTVETGRRILPSSGLSPSNDAVSIRTHVQRWEVEEHSLVRSGRSWLGEYFSAGIPTRSFSLTTPQRIPGSAIRLDFQGVSTVSVASTLQSPQRQIPLPRIGTDRYDRKGQWVQWQESRTEDGPIRLTLQSSAGGSGGFYLDRIIWTYDRPLDVAEQPFVWSGAGVMEASQTGWAWSQTTGELRRISVGKQALPASNSPWIIWQESQARRAGRGRLVNLRQTSAFRPVDLVIVAAPAFVEQAQRYAQWKLDHASLHVEVWSTEQIYARYSAGMPDPTAIRNLMLGYFRGREEVPYSLLLFGDATYDTKNYLGFSTFHPDYWVPTYISRESLEPIYSFNSDDYFGILEEGEGEWAEGGRQGSFWLSDPAGNHTLDISVGRLPVQNQEQARVVVNKLIRYQESPEGPSRLVWAADDGDGLLHAEDAEGLSDYVSQRRPDIVQQKVFLGAFPNRVNGRVPEATQTFFRMLEDSPMLINYTGHGSELVLAEERLFEGEMISAWRNVPRPPLWVTATCEFGRFDNPALVSAGESLVLAPNGGAIGLLTTTRPVFSNTNFVLNYALYQVMLEEEGLTVGEIFRRTKNLSIVGVLNRNFTLLGDPTLRLPWSRPTIATQSLDEEGFRWEGFVGDTTGTGTIVAQVFLPEQRTVLREGQSQMSIRMEVRGPSFAFPVERGRFRADFPDVFPAGEGRIRWSWENRTGVSVWKKTTAFVDRIPPRLEMITEASGALTLVARDSSGIYQGNLPDPHAGQFSWDGLVWQPLGVWEVESPGVYRQTLRFPPSPRGEIYLRVSDIHTNRASGSFLWGETQKEPDWQVKLYPNPVVGPLTVQILLDEGPLDGEVIIEFFDPTGTPLYVRTESCYICTPIWEFRLPDTFPRQGMVLYRVRVVNPWNQQTYQTQGRVYFAR